MNKLLMWFIDAAGYTQPMERLNDVLAQLDVLIRYGADEL
jgi:hypothetical protein